KKSILSGILVMCTIGFSYGQANTSILPQNAQDFITDNFGSETVKTADKEDKWFSWDKNEMYEVHLSNGVKIDFNKQGEATEIDSRKDAPIPESALPESITSYVSENYSGQSITSWEMDNDEHEVELSDGTDLEFDK